MKKNEAIEAMQQIRKYCEEQTICRECPIQSQCFSIFRHNPRTWADYDVPRKAIPKGDLDQ